MEIKKENVLAAYETARKAGADSTMKVLESLFGEETFKPKDVTERIKTFEDACQELGEEHPFVVAYRAVEDIDECSGDIEAYLKLRIIVAALNEGWEPQFTEDEWRWYPWFFMWTSEELDEKDNEWKEDRHLMSTGDFHTGYASIAFAGSGHAPSYTDAYFGSRLCLKNEALAEYCGKQFIELWADFNLIRKAGKEDDNE